MSVSRSHSVKSKNFAAKPGWLRLRTEIEFNGLPRIAALCLQTQTCGRFIAAVHAGLFAPAMTRHSVCDAVPLPLCFLQLFCIARIMRVGHEVASTFPTPICPCRDRPG